MHGGGGGDGGGSDGGDGGGRPGGAAGGRGIDGGDGDGETGGNGGAVGGSGLGSAGPELDSSTPVSPLPISPLLASANRREVIPTVAGTFEACVQAHTSNILSVVGDENLARLWHKASLERAQQTDTGAMMTLSASLASADCMAAGRRLSDVRKED